MTILPLVLLVACQSESGFDRIREEPEVTITSPGEDALLRQGEPVSLRGEVLDEHDAPDELVVSWRLDAGEAIAATPDPDGLVSLDIDGTEIAIGTHEVALSATDTDGLTTTARVVFLVEGPLSAPVATIVSPEDGATYGPGEAIALRGEGTDEATAPDDLVFAWTSDLQGPLEGSIDADGQSALFLDGLDAGTHLVTLDVTDTDGETGSDAITVHVVDEPEEAQVGDLVISEMMVDPNVVYDEQGEWIEFYNTAGYSIDIRGYTLRDDDYDAWIMDDSFVIPPRSYYVLCAELDTSINGGVPCDGWFFRDYQGEGMALANKPDEVVLARPDGVEIDHLAYDDTWFEMGVAVGVDPSLLDADDNDARSAWCSQRSVIATGGEPGTPGLENDPCD